MPVADVRDTAAHHVMCIKNKLTFGQRYILNSGSYWFRELAQIFNKQYKKFGYGMPESEVGSFMFRVSSWFDSTLSPMVPFYDREMWFETTKIKKAMNYVLKWRSIGQTLRDMTDEFIAKGWIEDLVTGYNSVEEVPVGKAEEEAKLEQKRRDDMREIPEMDENPIDLIIKASLVAPAEFGDSPRLVFDVKSEGIELQPSYTIFFFDWE
jgi:hypothetical protein